MLLGGLCENLESIHETEDEICHKNADSSSFILVNFFRGNISPSTLGTAFKFLHTL
jgi:hypothetical protein